MLSKYNSENSSCETRHLDDSHADPLGILVSNICHKIVEVEREGLQAAVFAPVGQALPGQALPGQATAAVTEVRRQYVLVAEVSMHHQVVVVAMVMAGLHGTELRVANCCDCGSLRALGTQTDHPMPF